MKFLLAVGVLCLASCDPQSPSTKTPQPSNMTEIKSSQALEKFQRLLAEQAHADTPEAIIPCMMSFYREIRATDCDVAEDGDMLLYQWGTYDWGEGRWFELNITRQFIPSGGDDEDIFQLSVTARYPPSTELDAFKSGNRWASSPDDLAEFESFIRSSEPMKALKDKPAARVVISYEPAG